MWKWVIRDYFAAFRPEKLKKAMGNSGWWMYLYFGAVLPMMFQVLRSARGTTIYYLICLPILFGVLTSMLHPLKLPKVMFLCPMQEELRKKYIVRSVLFRGGVLLTITFICVVILLSMRACDGLTAGVLILNMTVMTLVFCGYNGVQKTDKAANQRSVADNVMDMASPTMGVAGAVALVLSLVSSMLLAFFMAKGDVEDWLTFIFAGVAIFLQIPLTIPLLKNWNNAMECAASYERSYL